MKYIHRLCTIVMFMLVPLMQTAYALDTHAQPTSSTPSEASGIACPSSDQDETQGFKRFLSAFIKNAEIRQAYTPSKVDVRTLDLQLADRQDMYTKALVPQATILSALFDTALATEREVKVASVESQRAVVSFLYPQHLEDKDTLIFEKTQRCWRLKTVFRDPLPFPSVLPNKSAQKAERCFKKADKRRGGFFAEPTEDGNFYDRALYGYLCAAQNGSDEGAMAAATLCTNRNSRPLPSDYVKAIVMRFGGDHTLAEYYCGTSVYIVPALKLKSCLDPKKAYHYISRSVADDGGPAAEKLGLWLEHGMLGKVNLPGALACYKLAATYAPYGDFDENYQRLFNTLKKSGIQTQNIREIDCPIDPSVTLKDIVGPNNPSTQLATQKASEIAEQSCADSFWNFLYTFLRDIRVRQTYTRPQVNVRTLDIQAADRKEIYIKEVLSRDTILSRLFDVNRSGRPKSSLIETDLIGQRKPQIEDWDKPGEVAILLFDAQHLEYKDILVFEKTKRCWRLKTVIRDSIPPPDLLPKKNLKKAKHCLRAGKRYFNRVENMRQDGDVSENSPLRFVCFGCIYDRALYGYLCAAQNGSAEAAMWAAELGSSGQSRLLPDDYITKLLMQDTKLKK